MLVDWKVQSWDDFWVCCCCCCCIHIILAHIINEQVYG